MTLTRRSLLRGIGALLAAPAIVRAASLMPINGDGVALFSASHLDVDFDTALLVVRSVERYSYGFVDKRLTWDVVNAAPG